MTARPMGALALDYCLDNAPASDAGLARAYVERLERLAEVDGPAMIAEVGKRLAAVEAERDALKAALEASRADAARLYVALSALKSEADAYSESMRSIGRGSMELGPDAPAYTASGDAAYALSAHRALNGGAL